MPSPPELARRLPRCILGLAAFGAGIAAIVAADVGLAPWDVFHQGASERLGLSIGTVIEGVGLLLLLLWIPLRQRFGIGTLLNALEIGIVVDLVLPRLHTPDPLVGRLALLLGGMAVIALGSGLYIGSGLGSGPRDGLMVGLHERFGWSIQRSRTLVEVAALTLGIALGGSTGLGTVVFALGIGPMAQVTLPWFELPPLTRRGATGGLSPAAPGSD
ncbi:MAG: hypothetical protein R2715_15875 [Ilumatobacteraceae bacterium]